MAEAADEWGDFIQKQPQGSPDQWADFNPQSAQQQHDQSVPESLAHRLYMGLSLEKAATGAVKGAKEGFGDEKIGLSDEEASRARDAGLFYDPAGSEKPKRWQLLSEAAIRAAAVAGDVTMRSINSAIYAGGGAVGEMSGNQKLHDEAINLTNFMLIDGGRGSFSRMHQDPQSPISQTIGPLPKAEDFSNAANVIAQPQAAVAPSAVSANITEQNIRELWRERAVLPSEAAHDATVDGILKRQLNTPPADVPDRSGIPHPRNSPVPEGTPRSQLALTGDGPIDAVIGDQRTKAAIDNPVINRANDVPSGAGADAGGNGLNIDRHIPEIVTVDGVAFDPADPLAVRSFVERDTAERLINGGMETGDAHKVARFEFADKAEAAWYKAHDIDQAKAEAEYQPYLDQINHENPETPPPNLSPSPEATTTRMVAAHEADAKLTAPEAAEGVRDRITVERNRYAEEQPPHIKAGLEAAARQAGYEPTAEGGARPSGPSEVVSGGGATEPAAPSGVGGAEPGAVDKGSTNVGPEGAVVSGAGQRAGETATAAAGLDREPGLTALIAQAKGIIERTARPQEQESLLQFIARAGGISMKDANISDVRSAIGRKNQSVGRLGALIQESGISLERMAMAAKEAGFFHDQADVGGGVSDFGKDALLEAMKAELSGIKQYRLGVEPPHAKIDPAEESEYRERAGELMDREGADPLAHLSQRDIDDFAWAPHALGAEATTPLPTLAQQPPAPPGRLLTAAQSALSALFDVGRDIQMKVAPMATGGKDAMRLAKDFANNMRRNTLEWGRIDEYIKDNFTAEQRERMWNAADEESVLRQEGKTSEHMGLATLTPEELAAVNMVQERAQLTWLKARDLGMVKGEGLPAYTPRIIINAAEATTGEGAIPLNGLGANLRIRTSQMLHRKYLTAEETEAAAKAALGAEAQIVRDIRTLPLATKRLEDAIAGRSFVNEIKENGKRTGSDTIAEGFSPQGSDERWFTIDNPALKTWRPKFATDETTGTVSAVKDADGNIIFEQAPIYVRGDFEGPLRSVLRERKGAQGYIGSAYAGLMSAKGKTMSLIMYSPIIHNAVEWGRALPALPGKVASFKVYFEGNRAKNNPAIMREAVDSGLVPIGHRFFNQDITSMMEEPSLTPGRSFTSKVLGFIPGLFDPAAETAVRTAIDKAGDFWHNTLLWDRVADLQMGLYTNFRDEMIAKGQDADTASRAAAHWANRYAGALPQEAMSEGAQKLANLAFFSRTFTLGNLGAMKDAFSGLAPKAWNPLVDLIGRADLRMGESGGLPRDVMAQIEHAGGDLGEQAVGAMRSLAVRKAVSVVMLDMGLFYVGNSILQSSLNVMRGDDTIGDELRGYANRMSEALQKRIEHPMSLLQPFDFMQSVGSTSENEPNRQDRIKVGNAADGTAIYARNPVGKIGEEFVGWLNGPLDMIRRKLGTVARPIWSIVSNDRGFGRKVYDPDADTPLKYAKNAAAIAFELVRSQIPEGSIGALSDLVTGQGDAKVNALQTFGPVAGVTFSKGAPGGPAVGELYRAREQHDFAINAALPGIRRQIQQGDLMGAVAKMQELGIPQGLQRFYVKTTMDPATRLGGRTLRDFYLYATPEQRARMDRATSGQ